MTRNIRMRRRLRGAATACTGAAIALGLSVLVGWAVDIDGLKRIRPGFEAMMANTAFCFILLGSALVPWKSRRAQPVRRTLGAMVATIGAVTLVEYLWGVNLGIDEILFVDVSRRAAVFPGRMAPTTAVNMMLCGVAVMSLGHAAATRFGRAAVAIVATVSFVGLCGYIYGEQAMYAIQPYPSMAVHTAVGFLLVSTAYTLGHQELVVLVSDTATGRLLRRLLPALIVLPVLTGWLPLMGERAGLYDPSFGAALLVVVTVVALTSLTVAIAASLYEHEVRAHAVVSSALDAVIMIDELGRIVEFNPAAERMFGYRRRHVIGMPVDRIVPPAHRHAHRGGLLRHLTTGEDGSVLGRVVELSGLRADGSEFPIELAVSQVHDRTPPMFTGFIRDLTERKRQGERFRDALEAAPTGMLIVDSSGSIGLVNTQIEKMFGYQRSEILGRQVDTLIPDRFRVRHADDLREFFGHLQTRPMGAGRELFGRRRDGSELPVEVGLNPIETTDGGAVLVSVLDVSERKEAERERTRLLGELQTLARNLERRVETQTREIRDSEARYRALFDDSPVPLWEADFTEVRAFLDQIRASGVSDMEQHLTDHPDAVSAAASRIRILNHNRRAMELFEASSSERLLEELPRTRGPEGLVHFRRQLTAMLAGQTSFEASVERQTLTGRQIYVNLRTAILPGHESDWARLVGSMLDITAATLAERQIRNALAQRDVLLKEIHHRVKNNLAVMSSLFFLESTYGKDPQTIALLEDSRRRVRSMALVHEALYGSDNLAQVEFAEYLRVLAGELHATYRTPADNVRLHTDLDPLSLTIDLAVPCGLILNELLTNAFKHAFPDGRRGSIVVSLRTASTEATISVKDDGVGMPHIDAGSRGSLGLRLVSSLSKQIRASVTFGQASPGTVVTLNVGTTGAP